MDPVTAGVPAAPAAPAPAPAVPNPHPAAVQPPPAGVPNPLAPAPAAPTINYNIAAPAPAPVPANQQVAAPATGTLTPPPTLATNQQMVSLPLEQLQAFVTLQARVAQMEAEQHAREQAAQAEQARILAERGQAIEALNMTRAQHEQALQAERQRAQQVEADAARYALDGELSRALAAQPLRPHAAEQLTTLWRGNFSAVRENGTFAVRTPTFETPAQFVTRMASDPAYAHFFQPQTQGGTATGQPVQAAHTPPAQPTAAPQPANMGEAVIAHMNSLARQQGDGRLNLSVPMGLRRS